MVESVNRDFQHFNWPLQKGPALSWLYSFEYTS